MAKKIVRNNEDVLDKVMEELEKTENKPEVESVEVKTETKNEKTEEPKKIETKTEVKTVKAKKNIIKGQTLADFLF